MGWTKTIQTRRSRLAAARRKRNQDRLLGELLERRFAPAGLPITFTVPVEVANQGVYVAVFGNPTTSNTASFTVGSDNSMTVGNSALFTSGQSTGSFIGEVTITDLTKTTIYKYQTNVSNTLGGLTYVSGDTNHTYVPGSVVSFAGPDIAQAPFVYLGSPTAAVTTTARTTPTQTVQPVLPGVLPVKSTTGFEASGSLKVFPKGQPQNAQLVTYTGIAGNSFTGVVCASGIGLKYVVEKSDNAGIKTKTFASISRSQPTTVPVNSTTGFPTAGNAVAFLGTQTVRFTYTGTAANSFTGVWFLDNAAINYDQGVPANTATIVAANALGSTITVGPTTVFAGSGQ
ncbi:MAG: hypothetical protein NTZ28_05705, partial [Nitrospirae bacterium]|nr:hypothetical protein [Nitrospirota bacterium]